MTNQLSRAQDETQIEDLRLISVAMKGYINTENESALQTIVEKIYARATFGFRARSLRSICTLVVLLIAVALTSACVSDTPLVITEYQQCQNESSNRRLKKHRTLVAEGFILYQPKTSDGMVVVENNRNSSVVRLREKRGQIESYSVYTRSGQDTGVGFLAEFISAEIQEALKKNSSTDYQNLPPTRMRIIASTYDCNLNTRKVIKIEEADTGKVLYENKSASRDA